LDYLLAAPAQLLSMFLVFCLLANWWSILAPMAIRAGSLRAAQPKGFTILLHIAFTFLFPLVLLPTLLPLGIEVLLNRFGLMIGMPIGLVLTVLESVGIGFLYRLVLASQGNLLQSREQRILHLVTVKSE
jgi:ABC-2 type transport system permease protein